MAHDAITDTLYAVDNGFRQLLVIDQATGAATSVAGIGSLGTALIEGLGHDDASGTLYGVDRSTAPPTLVAIDKTSGTISVVGRTGPNVTGLTAR